MTASTHPLDLLKNVDVQLSVELGRTQLPLRQVLELREASVVPLDRLTDELLDVQVNGHTIAKAEILADGNRFALKIVQMSDEGAPHAASAATPADDQLGAAASEAIAKAAASGSKADGAE